MADEKKPFHTPFSALANLRDALPQGSPPPTPTVKLPPRAVVRLERAGRKGKEVTVVEHLELNEAMLNGWLKELKSSLGCGGTIEEHALVLQGDLRERVKAWLLKKGVKKVS